MKGSQTTGQPSSTPNSWASASRSSSVVTGVIRSTMQFGNGTCSSIQPARSASLRRANAPIILWATSPLPAMLSHDITVNGSVPSERRRRSASTMNPNAVPGTAPSSRSLWIAGSVSSNSPVAWFTW